MGVLRAEEEPHFRRTVIRHAQLMRIRGGCRRAAEVIESIVYAGADFGELREGRDADVLERADLAAEGADDAAKPTPAPARTLLQQPAAMVKRRPHVAESEEAVQTGNDW